jgi:uncharacterized protein with GYD domain
MAMFVVLGKFTTQGAKSLPDLRKFAEGNQERESAWEPRCSAGT